MAPLTIGELRKYRLRTSDCMAFLAIVAIWITLGKPMIQQSSTPSAEASVLIRFEVPCLPTPIAQTREDHALAYLIRCSNYLRSPQAARDVLADPRIRTQAFPPAEVELRRQLQESLRIELISNTFLIRCSLDVDDPAPDTALLNAVAQVIVEPPHRGLEERITLLSLATPPTLPATLPRAIDLGIDWFLILVASLATFATLRMLGAFLYPPTRRSRAS
jgi:hypothetical protein